MKDLRQNVRSAASGVLTSITCASLVGFAGLIVGLHFFTTRLARREAEARLRAAAADMVDELDGCVGRQLAYVGKTICERYGSPEAMKGVDMQAVMKAYGLDELNAIDASGVIVASNLPIVGDDQWKKENPRQFNQALLQENRGVFAQCFRPSADEPDKWYKYVGVAFPAPAKGYLQLGFCRARMQTSFDYTLRDVASDWHIGETGFYILSRTSNGEILSTLDESLVGETLSNLGFDVFTARRGANVERRSPQSKSFRGFDRVNFFESDFAGRRCLCTSGVVNQFHRYVAAIPLADVYASGRRVVLLTAILLFVALVVVDLFLSRILRKNAQLREFMAKEREQREKDLSVAKTIQISSLPPSFPDGPDWRIFARMDTAREVGGDFFDFEVLPDGRVFVLIADVSGKGIPAAMFMMKAKTTIRACIHAEKALAAAVALANDRLSENNDANMFVTAWFALFDPKTGALEYVNAGHNLPLVRRADGKVEWIRGRHGLVLAAMGGMPYSVGRMTLARGDSLFLYTDGVTEAMNGADELYGEDRLERALAASGDRFVTDIRRDVDDFVGDAEQSDDITLLALDYKRI